MNYCEIFGWDSFSVEPLVCVNKLSKGFVWCKEVVHHSTRQYSWVWSTYYGYTKRLVLKQQIMQLTNNLQET